MPNGNQMKQDLQFEELIKSWSIPEQNLARWIREVKEECVRRQFCPSPQFTKRQVTIGISGASLISLAVGLLLRLGEKIWGG